MKLFSDLMVGEFFRLYDLVESGDDEIGEFVEKFYLCKKRDEQGYCTTHRKGRVEPHFNYRYFEAQPNMEVHSI